MLAYEGDDLIDMPCTCACKKCLNSNCQAVAMVLLSMAVY